MYQLLPLEALRPFPCRWWTRRQVPETDGAALLELLAVGVDLFRDAARPGDDIAERDDHERGELAKDDKHQPEGRNPLYVMVVPVQEEELGACEGVGADSRGDGEVVGLVDALLDCAGGDEVGVDVLGAGFVEGEVGPAGLVEVGEGGLGGFLGRERERSW